MLKQFANRWALVTGPSSGIGSEFARQLAERGMHLVLAARNTEAMQQLSSELHQKHATRCEIVSVDLSTPDGVAALVQHVRNQKITVDLLVNNAGFAIVGEFDQIAPERVQEMLRLNVLALTELTYQFVPEMLQRGEGAVVNVSSIAAFAPVVYMGAYAATKSFVLHFTEALAGEIHQRGVTALAVCPGVTRTNFFDVAGAPGWLQKHASQSPQEVVEIALESLEKRRNVVVCGWRNYFMSLLPRIASRRRVVNESKKFFRPARKPGN